MPSIIIYGLNFAPEKTGVGKYTGEQAFWLAENGWDVTVVCANPYYPNWEILSPYQNVYSRKLVDGVNIYRCPIYVPKNPSMLRRIVHLFSFVVSSLPILLFLSFRKKFDLVFATEPTIFVTINVLIFKFINRCKTWLHVQDFEIDAGLVLGQSKKSIFSRVAGSLDLVLHRQYDIYSSISVKMCQKLSEKIDNKNSVTYFPNWLDSTKIYYSIRAKHQLIDELHAKNLKVILYAGNIGEKQGLENLLHAAAMLHHKNYHFIISGDGSGKEKLRNLRDELKLQNITFLELSDDVEFNNLLNAADLHIVLQKGIASDLVMPSKLINIWGCGGSVIASAPENSEIHDVLTKHTYLGQVIAPDSVVQLTSALDEFKFDDSDIAKQKIADFALQEYSKDVVLGKIFSGFVKKG